MFIPRFYFLMLTLISINSFLLAEFKYNFTMGFNLLVLHRPILQKKLSSALIAFFLKSASLTYRMIQFMKFLCTSLIHRQGIQKIQPRG